MKIECAHTRVVDLDAQAQNLEHFLVPARGSRRGQFKAKSAEHYVNRFHCHIKSHGECWLWTGRKNELGYGYFTVQRRARWAHRISYMMFNGPIPEGMNILHRCDNPSCVNPDHLEAGTQSQNILDCVARGRHPESLKTACKNGHTYTEESTYYVPRDGHRQCRICRRATRRAVYERTGN